MNVPLISNNEFIGTLNLGSRTRVFQSEELLELRQLATLAGISLDRFADLTRVKANTRRCQLYARQLEILNELSEQLLVATTLQQVLDKTGCCVQQLVGARRVSFCTLEPDGKHIRINALVGGVSDHPGLLVPLEDSGLAISLIHGKAQFVPELIDSPTKAHRSLGRSGLHHLWSFPIKHTNQILGTLIIATERTELASDEATAILGNLARLLEATLNRIVAMDSVTPLMHNQILSHDIRCHSLRTSRSELITRLDRMLTPDQSNECEWGVLSVDLTLRGKHEHTLTRTTNDDLFENISLRLSQHLRSTDVLVRIDDGFILLLCIKGSTTQLRIAAMRILQLITRPAMLDSVAVEIKASIGASRFPADAHGAEDLLRFSEIARDQAKEVNDSHLELFSPPQTPSIYSDPVTMDLA